MCICWDIHLQDLEITIFPRSYQNLNIHWPTKFWDMTRFDEKPVTNLQPFSVRKQCTNLKLSQMFTSFLLYTLLAIWKAQNESILLHLYYQNLSFYNERRNYCCDKLLPGHIPQCILWCIPLNVIYKWQRISTRLSPSATSFLAGSPPDNRMRVL